MCIFCFFFSLFMVTIDNNRAEAKSGVVVFSFGKRCGPGCILTLDTAITFWLSFPEYFYCVC